LACAKLNLRCKLAFTATNRYAVCCQSSALPTELPSHFYCISPLAK